MGQVERADLEKECGGRSDSRACSAGENGADRKVFSGCCHTFRFANADGRRHAKHSRGNEIPADARWIDAPRLCRVLAAEVAADSQFGQVGAVEQQAAEGDRRLQREFLAERCEPQFLNHPLAAQCVLQGWMQDRSYLGRNGMDQSATAMPELSHPPTDRKSLDRNGSAGRVLAEHRHHGRGDGTTIEPLGPP